LIARLGESGIYIYIFKCTQMIYIVLRWVNSQNTLSGLKQWAILTIETWCSVVGLLVNPDKTELVAFTRKRNLLGLFEPYIFGII
jgi:hypothetical protein